jgi:hypothetical protein
MQSSRQTSSPERVQRFLRTTPERIEHFLRATPARAAWMILGGLFAAAMLVFGTMQAVTALAHEEETFVDDFAASDVATIDVRNDAGGVTIRGSDSNSDTITVRSEVSHGLRRTGHSERIQGNRLVLDSSCPIFFSTFCNVTYTVDVPTEIDVVVRGSAGSITVSDVTGDVDLATDGGGVDVTRVDGGLLRMDSDAGSVSATRIGSSDVEATSDGGGVHVVLVQPPQSVHADSDGGGVEVVLPRDDDIAYRVEAHSSAGGEENLVNTNQDSDRTITATSDGGGITVRYGD